MTPIAWYDPSNGVVSKDKNDPAFTPLGQVLPLYSTPQPAERKPWVGLTDAEVDEILDREIGFNSCFGPETGFARVIEAKLKEKNT